MPLRVCTKIHASVRAALPPPALPEKSVFRRELPQDLVAFSSKEGRSLVADGIGEGHRDGAEAVVAHELGDVAQHGSGTARKVQFFARHVSAAFCSGYAQWMI